MVPRRNTLTSDGDNETVTRRLYLIAFFAIAVIAGLSVYVATRVAPSDLGGAGDLSVKAQSVPALAAAKGWINSPPLSPQDLRGKVVVYDFWTYSCVNCVRTLPHLKALYDRYAKRRSRRRRRSTRPSSTSRRTTTTCNTRCKQLGVTWPVALDDNMAIWNTFGNNYWPEEYLTDRDGRLRQVYIGEGEYDQKEDDVRTLLGEAATAPRAANGGPDEPQSAVETPEIHFGLSFGAKQFSSSTPASSPKGRRPSLPPARCRSTRSPSKAGGKCRGRGSSHSLPTPRSNSAIARPR